MKLNAIKSHNSLGIIVLGVVLALATSGVAQAHDTDHEGRMWSQDEGFRLGFALGSANVNTEDKPDDAGARDIFFEEDGGGLSFSAGYQFTPLFSLNLAFSGAGHETTDNDINALYGTALIEGHFTFLHESRVRPYLVAGFGGAVMAIDDDDYDTQIEGSVFSIGIGMLWNLTDNLMLDTSLRADGIDWEDRKFVKELPGGHEVTLAEPVDEEGGAGRFLLGLTYAF